MMIEARGLVRTFKTKRGPVNAVQGVDLDVADGEIVGFLGPNGAGKTTTMRMLATLIKPTSGTATVAGCDLAKNPVGVRRGIGYVPQSGSTLPEAIAGDEVVHHARLNGVPKTDAVARGQRLQHIRGLRERGATIFLTTHYLDEADALCDRILVIDHGRIVASGTPESLKQQVSGDAVRLSLADGDRRDTVLKVVDSLPGATESAADADLVSFRVPRGGSVLPGLLRTLDAQGVELEGVEVHRPTLDDVFLTMTGRSLRDDESAPQDAEHKEMAK
jgi:ABC-2 type transport system ATP-binding protein